MTSIPLNRYFLRPLHGAAIRYLSVALIASLAVGTPAQLAPISANTGADVLAIQAMVARVYAVASTQSGRESILDLQRILAESTGSEQQGVPAPAPACWATAPVTVRAEALALTPAVATPETPVVEVHHVQHGGDTLPPPLASRGVERYRMRLTPHAPPRYPAGLCA